MTNLVFLIQKFRNKTLAHLHMVADWRREMMDGKLDVVAAVEGNHIKISETSKTLFNNDQPPVKQKLLHKE